MSAEELARIWFEAGEEEKRAVNEGRGSIKNPGLEWILWRWEQVSEGGRVFQTAVAKRVKERLGI